MPLDLDALATFVKVADLASFTRAAEHLNVPKARVSLQIKRLENDLGTRLFQRSTRLVRLSHDGEQLLARARRLLVDAEEIATLYQSTPTIRGRVRIDLPTAIARDLILPRIPELLAKHPKIELTLSATDRLVDAFREGFDCILRVGTVKDSDLVGRTLGTLQMINCASPSYLREHGIPKTLDDLAHHTIVHYASTLGSEAPLFEYPTREGYTTRRMRSSITVNNTDTYRAAGIAGLGIIQVPRIGSFASLASGALVEVLPMFKCAPMPVALYHTHGRNVPRRVRVTLEWITEQLKPYLQEQLTR